MEKLLENLNEQQAQAVKHASGPLLIVAGAGTGKTTVITRRVAYLIEKQLAKPDEILALTFTEKAAAEMQERVDLLLPLGFYDLWISTFHSFCERILKNHALDIGLPNDFKLLDEIQQWIFVYKNFDKFGLNYYRPLGSPNRFIDALLKHFSRCKDELISPQEYLKYGEELKLALDSAEGAVKSARQKAQKPKRQENKAQVVPPGADEVPTAELFEISRIEEIANAFHTYEKLKLDNNCLDFGDLINFTLELFQKRPKILAYYQKKFKYLMVDEFQDTNFAQYQLVKLLASGSRSTSSGHNLTVVGDDDQSIYKFRGASVSNILKFKEDYKTAKQITLVENYRNGQKILDLAYHFIQANNPERLEIKLNINKKLKSNSDKPGIIEVIEGEDLSQELNAVAKKIIELKNPSPITPGNKKGETTNVSWNDFAILIRANSAAEELLPVLSSYGIPYTYVANRGLYKKPIILDLLSYMKLLDNAHDSMALYRCLNLPKFQLSHDELSSLLLLAQQKTLSLFAALLPVQTSAGFSAESKTKISNLLQLLQKHAVKTKTVTAAEMMVEIVGSLGLEDKLKNETYSGAESRELLDQFYKKIEDFEKQNEHKDLHNFLAFLQLEMEAGSEGEIKFDPNLGPESVKVLTIHSAKGLEFQQVFVINLVDQRFPTREKSELIEIPEALIKDILPEGDFHLQEERRLFYVGLTRAKRGLYLTWAKDYGGARLKKPSQFLLETTLVPSDKVSQATGKVIFSKPVQKTGQKTVFTKLPNRFSYTELGNFETCPLKYKYVHYLKLPLPGSYQASFGSTIHKTFEEFLKLYKNNAEMNQTDLFGKKSSSQPLPDFKLLETFYQKNWVDDWYPKKEEKEKYRAEGFKMLKTFYDNLEWQKPKPKYIEQFFKLKLPAPKDLAIGIKLFDFVGKIDRADQVAEGLEIIDYKTGKAPKTKQDINQLYVYQWAAQEFLREKVVNLKYWYLQNNQFVEEPKADEQEISRLKEELTQLITKIIHVTRYDLFKEEDLRLRQKGHECDFASLE